MVLTSRPLAAGTAGRAPRAATRPPRASLGQGGEEEPQVRAALIEVLSSAGRLALLSPERVGDRQGEQIVEVLAEQGEWADLWWMVPALPLADAVKTAARMPPAFRPADPLFDLLACHDHTEIGLAFGALSGVGSISGPGYDEDSKPFTPLGAISPDGRRLLAWCSSLYDRNPTVLVTYTLPDGEISEEAEVSWVAPPRGRLLDTGEAVFLYVDGRWMYRLERRPRGRFG